MAPIEGRHHVLCQAIKLGAVVMLMWRWNIRLTWGKAH